jgi:hypothetical protein
VQVLLEKMMDALRYRYGFIPAKKRGLVDEKELERKMKLIGYQEEDVKEEERKSLFEFLDKYPSREVARELWDMKSTATDVCGMFSS